MSARAPMERTERGVTNRDTLKAYLIQEHDKGRSWRSIAADDFPGVKPGTLCRIAKDGYEPKSNRVRKALGLPVYVQVEACRSCGQAHATKRCTTKKRRRYKHLSDIPTPILAWMIRERKELRGEECPSN